MCFALVTWVTVWPSWRRVLCSCPVSLCGSNVKFRASYFLWRGSVQPQWVKHDFTALIFHLFCFQLRRAACWWQEAERKMGGGGVDCDGHRKWLGDFVHKLWLQDESAGFRQAKRSDRTPVFFKILWFCGPRRSLNDFMHSWNRMSKRTWWSGVD